MYPRNNPNLFIGIIGIIALIIAAEWFDKKYRCGPKSNHISRIIENFGDDSLALREIVLLESYPGYEGNLISETIRINNCEELWEIQRIISSSKRRLTNHPLTTWSVDLKIVFTNNDSLMMAVSKIKNDPLGTMTTYFSFPGNNCSGDEVYYSMDLGYYLEHLTSYQGKAPK